MLWAPVTLPAGDGRAWSARACLVMRVGNREESGSPSREERKLGVSAAQALCSQMLRTQEACQVGLHL